MRAAEDAFRDASDLEVALAVACRAYLKRLAKDVTLEVRNDLLQAIYDVLLNSQVDLKDKNPFQIRHDIVGAVMGHVVHHSSGQGDFGIGPSADEE